jgi:hypothetical protein
LPHAPTNSRIAITVSVPDQACSIGSSAAAFITARKSSVPKEPKIRSIPSRKPASPMRFTMNAFLPASEALSLWNQNPISR